MKIFFLLIILGFSQVLGKNYGSLTESKLKRENQLDNKIEVVNNNLADLEDEPLELEELENNLGWEPAIDRVPFFKNNSLTATGEPKIECRDSFTFCSSNEDCKQCSDCPNGAYCEPELHSLSSCECFAQPQCNDICSSNEDCEQCSNCSNGAYCYIPRDPGFNIGFDGSFYCFCSPNDDYYEYDNSMDYFNAKSDEVQSENEDKIIELEEMVSNNLIESEAAMSYLSQPKTECDKLETNCSSNEDCKQLRQLSVLLMPRLDLLLIILMTWICFHLRKVTRYTCRH